MAEKNDVDIDFGLASRRRFLRGGGALVGGAVMAGSFAGGEALAASDNADNPPPNVPEWMKTPGHPWETSSTEPLRRSRRVSSKIFRRICRECLSASGRTPL